nr:vegetative cell wall protein gp1-like [Aegilops tauschii subsp. strangulata]
MASARCSPSISARCRPTFPAIPSTRCRPTSPSPRNAAALPTFPVRFRRPTAPPTGATTPAPPGPHLPQLARPPSPCPNRHRRRSPTPTLRIANGRTTSPVPEDSTTPSPPPSTEATDHRLSQRLTPTACLHVQQHQHSFLATVFFSEFLLVRTPTEEEKHL